MAKAAAAAAAAAPMGPAPGPWRQPAGVWAGEAPKGRTGSAQLEALQRRVEELTRRLESAVPTSSLGGAAAAANLDQQDDEAGPDIGKLQAAQAAMAEAFGKDSQGAQWLQDKIQEHRKVKMDAKPLGTQALTAQRWADKKAKVHKAAEQKIASIQELVQDLQGRLVEAQREEVQAKEEMQEAKEALQAVHKKALAADEERAFAARAGGLWEALPAGFRAAPGSEQQLAEARRVLESIGAKAEEWAKANSTSAGEEPAGDAGDANGGDAGDTGMAVDSADDQFLDQLIGACSSGGAEQDVKKRVAEMLEAARAASQDAKRRKSRG